MIWFLQSQRYKGKRARGVVPGYDFKGITIKYNIQNLDPDLKKPTVKVYLLRQSVKFENLSSNKTRNQEIANFVGCHNDFTVIYENICIFRDAHWTR